MLVDKQRFKELKKAGGGISKLECALTIKAIDGFGEKNNQTCNFNIYPNGIYFDFVFSDKIYFPIINLKKVEYSNKTIEIYMKDEEIIKIEIEIEKDILKVYNTLRKHLGLAIEPVDIDKNKEELKEAWNDLKKTFKECPLKDISVKKTDAVDDNIVHCPKCGSTSITANKKGFSLAKGAAGVVAVGALGAVAAGHGKNKVIVTCLNCGHQWKPGK